ncbi:MAG: hypothetical protein Q9159_001068 [Coniocarpon cinnabarinum]
MPQDGELNSAANEASQPPPRTSSRPDFSQPPAPTKLPKQLQQTLDNDEKLWEAMTEGSGPDTTETNARYAAYAARARTILRAAHRYIAYTSDIGESFRPVAHPWLVRSAYGISWAYLTGDVANEGYKAYTRNQATLHPEEDTGAVHTASKDVKQSALAAKEAEVTETAKGVAAAARDLVQPTPGRIAPIDDYRTVMAERAVFQSIASMGLPAFTIHTIVKQSGRYLKNVKNVRIRTWGPIGLGLVVVPALPFIFDEPVETAVSWSFHRGFELWGGSEAVTGRAHGESKKEL